MLTHFPTFRHRMTCFFCSYRSKSNASIESAVNETWVGRTAYIKDSWTNVTPKILSLVGQNLHLQKYHPLSFIRQRIVDYIYNHFPRHGKSPLFSAYDDFSPVVSTQQNFDSLLIPPTHPSRNRSDCYYLNEEYLFRGHTSAHQVDLIKMGLSNFLVVGDVYRRDEIDSTHYPVFHQVEGVRLCAHNEVFKDESVSKELSLFEKGRMERTPDKQECHTRDAVFVMSQELKSCLQGLAQHLFGKGSFLEFSIRSSKCS